MTPVILQAVYGVLFLWAVWCICSRKVNDGILGRVFYSAIAVAAFAAFFAKHDITIERSNQMLIIAVALTGLRHFIMKYINTYRKQRHD